MPTARIRRLTIWLIAVGLVIAAVLYFRPFNHSGAEHVQSLARQVTMPVSLGTIIRTISTTGQLQPYQDENLTFHVAGKVTEILVSEGQRVREGDVLARIDDTAARLQHLRASSEYETALLSASTLIIEERRLELELAEQSLEGVILRAPFDGVIAEVDMKVGDTTTQEPRSDSPSIRLVDLDRYQIEVTIDQSDLTHVHVGQDVNVRIDSAGRLMMNGQVERVAILPLPVDNVVLYPVQVVLDASEAERPLRPGWTAHVDFVIERAENVIVVPLASVVEIGSEAWVTRVNPNGEEEIVSVETGVSDGLRIEIRSGLSEGDRILTNNHQLYQTLLSEGTGGSGGRGGGGSSTQIRLPLGGGVIRR